MAVTASVPSIAKDAPSLENGISKHIRHSPPLCEYHSVSLSPPWRSLENVGVASSADVLPKLTEDWIYVYAEVI
jgi:hypothetical protein